MLRSYEGFRPSSGNSHRVINGLSIYDDLGTYFVPSLGFQVSLCGPLAQRVLHTFYRHYGFVESPVDPMTMMMLSASGTG